MTLTKVAQRAGVSASTASRYLRGQLKVQEETAARIDEAVRELGYEAHRPEAAKSEQGSVVALVVPDLINPFFAALADETANLAAAAGTSLVVGVTGRRAERESSISALAAGAEAVDGLIYVGMHRRNPRLTQAVAEGLPVVAVDEEIDIEPDIDTVTVDNFGGAYQATTYLVQLGHRNIAHIAGPPELSTTQERLRGYREALQAAGLEFDPTLVLHGPYTEQFGASTFPHLAKAATAPTAVFVGSDIAAIGVLGAAELHGIRIPEDLSVVGCDGIRVGQWLRPKLTTLQQPITELAQAALDIISDRIAEPNSTSPKHRVLPLQLVTRGSASPVEHAGAARAERSGEGGRGAGLPHRTSARLPLFNAAEGYPDS
ncbi:LacI family transcriptional regulator [Saccharopolyspora karakumensis]|uniref:LacI family transcriptional regulator n=1 Tax=Saccharopolyspora karakumensis TaxID=2530386 RepID=A0A4R5C1D4_9PSEU|nr:LacI family transcriptional regulator [Saccharopolyspora karakumensis]